MTSTFMTHAAAKIERTAYGLKWRSCRRRRDLHLVSPAMARRLTEEKQPLWRPGGAPAATARGPRASRGASSRRAAHRSARRSRRRSDRACRGRLARGGPSLTPRSA
eukprot:2063092-Prymnesium_polylepis.3